MAASKVQSQYLCGDTLLAFGMLVYWSLLKYYTRLRATIAALVPECFVIRPGKPSMPREEESLFPRLNDIQHVTPQGLLLAMPMGREQAYAVVNDECLLDMENLKIIVTALAPRHILV